MSYARWGVEAFFVNEIAYFDDYQNLDAIFNSQSYDRNAYGKAMGAMFGIGCMWSFASFLCLKLMHRDKVK